MQKPDLTINDLAADFLQCPDRHDTGAEKWDRYQGRTTATGKEILPFWVADMDFQSPDVVLDAIHKRTDHAVFGYTHETPGFASTLTTHLREQHNWQIDPSWVIGVPGIVTGLSITARLLSQPSDGILTLTPVYQPFLFLPKLAERRSVRVPLHADVTAQRWTIDWELLEAAMTPDVKIFWLCHPHNPTGKVFTREELLRIADLCEKHGVTVVSDEIWDDLILDGSNHIPFASLDHPAARRSITFVAASKTWNIAGLGCAAAIVPNKDFRHQWRQAGGGLVPMVNPLGYTASEAAWKDGDAWRQKLLDVLKYNKQHAVQFKTYRAFLAYHHKQRISFGSTATSGSLVNLLIETNHNTFAKKLVSDHQMETNLEVQGFYDSTLVAHPPYYRKVSSDYETRLVHTKLLISSAVN